MPAAEVDVGPDLVRALLAEQHPDLATLPLTVLANGWDNVLLRLGDDLVVRLPRRAAAVQLVRNEQRWLPVLARVLPLPIPSLVRTGRPGAGYPWPWSITPYLAGDVVARLPPADPDVAALDLAAFLAALHRPAPGDAPRNAVRGVPLRDREAAVTRNLALAAAGRLLPPDAVAALTDVWHDALDAPAWDRPGLWCHGDLHPANVLVDAGRISAVLDFGDLTAGDPATDLSAVWSVLQGQAQETFWSAYADAGGPLDDALVRRARGWAAALGLVLVTHSADEPLLERIGHATVAAVLAA